METYILQSDCDGLQIETGIIAPQQTPRGIVQISHGMAEHKERYEPFMNTLAEHGFLCVIHDHRGHGASVEGQEDLGYFYTARPDYLVEDLYQVTRFVKGQYPGLNVTLFSHSMGTLVARNYLKRYDSELSKLILCGPPTYNPLFPAGILLAKLSALLKGDRHRSPLLQKLTFGGYNRGNSLENSWICSDVQAVEDYNRDRLCGYVFTNNGFLNLYRPMQNAFSVKGWQVRNPELPIFVIAGEEDPVIQSKQKFDHLLDFLQQRGYHKITARRSPGKRHELLNEQGKMDIYADITDFITC